MKIFRFFFFKSRRQSTLLHDRIRPIPLLLVGTMWSHLHELCHICERRVFRPAFGAMRFPTEFIGQGSVERRPAFG